MVRLQTAMLIIDPKDELLEFISKKFSQRGEEHRLVTISELCRLYFFEGMGGLPLMERMEKIFALFVLYNEGDRGVTRSGSSWPKRFFWNLFWPNKPMAKP